MNPRRAAAIADAVLYEGYILYPYRPSSAKNRQRWTFGGVFPLDYAASGDGDPCRMQTECLIEGGDDAQVEVRLRFLHIIERAVGAFDLPRPSWGGDAPEARMVPVLEVDGARYLAWEEAVEREVVAPPVSLAQLREGEVVIPFGFPASRAQEPIHTAAGEIAGVLIRTASPIAGRLTLAAAPVAPRVSRLTARVENLTPLDPPACGRRALAQKQAFASTHLLIGVQGGLFVSAIDPPDPLRAAAAACVNEGAWPVLVGEAGARDLMLAAPIILYDYPEIAPESPGDLFDATEIDEILSLRILTMTDEEKREMAAADPRGRALLERTAALTPADFARLHGTLRSPRAVPRLAALAIPGGELRLGDRVRLRPRPGADIMDIVLKDQIAIVEAIERDFEDRVHVAVTLLDDPGREFGQDRMPGHRFFFGLDEIEVLADAPP
ncbi:MAG: hypothetical protein JO209_02150 [Acidisphaera sp.]|nr:hypothetical protein [Acidisphaera sp.]